MQKFLLFILLLFPFVPFVSFADDNSNIIVSDSWSLPTIGNVENTAVYLNITNNGKEADTLLSAQSTSASKCEIHKTVNTDGVITMGTIDNLSIPAGTTVNFAPNGLHIMLMGLKQKLVLGDKLNVTLKFAKAGTVNTEVQVKAQPTPSLQVVPNQPAMPNAPVQAAPSPAVVQ